MLVPLVIAPKLREEKKLAWQINFEKLFTSNKKKCTYSRISRIVKICPKNLHFLMRFIFVTKNTHNINKTNFEGQNVDQQISTVELIKFQPNNVPNFSTHTQEYVLF